MANNLNLGQFIALIIPLVLVEFGLMGFALRDLVRRRQVKGGNKWPWGAIIILFGLIGPILYLVVGREEE